MKKFLIILGSLFASCVFGQGNFKFTEETHDFGQVPEGDSISYQFEFSNAGDQPLTITNVQPSCGCTVPKWSNEPVAPGGKGFILAKYATKGRPGKFTKYLTITSDALESSKQISFKGEVLPNAADVTPAQPSSTKTQEQPKEEKKAPAGGQKKNIQKKTTKTTTTKKTTTKKTVETPKK